jgi:sugar phosphate isomerase/epimerase
VELAGELGAPGVVIGPGKANPLFPAPRDILMGHFFAALDQLVPVAEKAGTGLWVENMPFAFLPRIDEMMAALDRYGNPALGVVWDAANSHFVDEDLGVSLRRCRDRLKLVHLSDTGRQVYRHDPVGMGTVPFAELPPVLAEVGYRELPMLEIISHDADRDIMASARRLTELGLAGAGGTAARRVQRA